MGYDEADIRNLFLYQGLLLGLIGGLLGLGTGHLASMSMGAIKIGGMVDTMRISYNPQIYLFGFFEALVASAASSFLPARSAGLLQPIDIVRSGE
jgi:lipoprotein-releasing system permease protein